MKDSESDPTRHDSIDEHAAAWVVRQERGLSAREQDEFSQWLAVNPRHRAAFAEQRWSWEELDRLNGLQTSVSAVPDPCLLAPRRHARSWRIAALPLIAAAAVMSFYHLARQPSRYVVPFTAPEALALCEQRKLDDGSLVELNRGASITVSFTLAERRVRLERGEAHFTVTHDPSRPFVVEAGGVAVRAVGTAFCVTRETGSVAVLVTEGKVRLTSLDKPALGDDPLLNSGQRAVVSLAPGGPAPTIAPVTADEIAERLAWKPRVLDFAEATLAEIATEFNRCNPVRLEITDPSLRARRLSATIRSDNVEGFVKLLESDFGIVAKRPSANVIALRSRN
ncbi:MAG: FecR domain-containing protein [Undibacterium sp.]|nr:FecR domain-containing protein [Opitutaceae bacterium]